jgi:hypothetical protein
VALPSGFAEGDEVPALTTDRWFGSREEALTALPALLDLEDIGQDPSWEDLRPIDVHHAGRIQDIPNVH